MRGNLWDTGGSAPWHPLNHQQPKPTPPKVAKTPNKKLPKNKVKLDPEAKGPDMTHDALAADLAVYLRGLDKLTWENIALEGAGSQRPDVFTICKTLNVKHCDPAVYECKVNRNDFLADVSSQKWRGYSKYSRCIWFAAPQGLIKQHEVPDECGLIVRGHSGWIIVKRPKPWKGWSLTDRVLLKLILGKWAA